MAQGGSRGGFLLARQALWRAGAATTVLLAIVVVAVLVGVSPFALTWLANGEGEWERLSQIGQTYGAASALLAALALGGIVFSLILQVREYRASREQALRMIHTDLLKMAMDDPLYRRSWGPHFASEDTDRQREHMYLNLVFSNMQMRWELRAISEHHLRASLGVVLSGAAGQRFWSAVRELRSKAVSGRRERRFHQIVEEEYQRAAPAEQEEPVSPPATRRAAVRRGRWLLVVAFAAAGGAAAILGWQRIRSEARPHRGTQ
jgi:hypothetical protein